MEFVNGFRMTSHIENGKKNPVMFQTTNHFFSGKSCENPKSPRLNARAKSTHTRACLPGHHRGAKLGRDVPGHQGVPQHLGSFGRNPYHMVCIILYIYIYILYIYIYHNYYFFSMIPLWIKWECWCWQIYGDNSGDPDPRPENASIESETPRYFQVDNLYRINVTEVVYEHHSLKNSCRQVTLVEPFFGWGG